MEVSWEQEKLAVKRRIPGRGGASVWDSRLFEGTSPPVRVPHSGTFQRSSRQSTVRGPGTDPRSACQQLISLIELARDPKSHVHHTRRHGGKHMHDQVRALLHTATSSRRLTKSSSSFCWIPCLWRNELHAFLRETLKGLLMVTQTTAGCVEKGN